MHTHTHTHIHTHTHTHTQTHTHTHNSNPEGPEKPNKKHYDPRTWLRKGEEAAVIRLGECMEDLNCKDVLA